MPIYEYRLICDDGTIEKFELMRSIDNRDDPAEAPSGRGFGIRVPSLTTSIMDGMTVSEKKLGTTKNRREWGKYMKDARTKRKQNYSPTSREGMSNELWLGDEVQRGIIAPPNEKQMGGIKKQTQTPQEIIAKQESAKMAASNWAKNNTGKNEISI